MLVVPAWTGGGVGVIVNRSSYLSELVHGDASVNGHHVAAKTTTAVTNVI